MTSRPRPGQVKHPQAPGPGPRVTGRLSPSQCLLRLRVGLSRSTRAHTLSSQALPLPLLLSQV
eukprot:2613074-Rhodomonas_salina.1